MVYFLLHARLFGGKALVGGQRRMTAGCAYGGGFMAGPEAQPDDGWLEVRGHLLPAD
jgi:hypothetical protein